MIEDKEHQPEKQKKASLCLNSHQQYIYKTCKMTNLTLLAWRDGKD
jgi:hypothetical protein